jgi:large subunit ribosomal protein L17
MRHRKRTAKLGMKSQHRRATLANLVCSLIKHNRITTTIAKAKETRRYADKMVTLAKKGTLHHRREAIAFLREKNAVKKLFTELGKQHADRSGGYTRVIRLSSRLGDAAEMAIVEWTGMVTPPVEPEKEKSTQEPKSKAKKPAKAKEVAEAKETVAAS